MKKYVVTYGAGSSSVVFRGATTLGGAQATASVYLDEISVTQTGSQPTIRTVDIARIEALSGPQGTLYGSDAQAGTMRIVTNQPVMDEFEAVIDGELRGGRGARPRGPVLAHREPRRERGRFLGGVRRGRADHSLLSRTSAIPGGTGRCRSPGAPPRRRAPWHSIRSSRQPRDR